MVISKISKLIRKTPFLYALIYPVFSKFIHPLTHKKKQLLIRKHGKDALDNINAIFNEAEVFFWIDFGTLLGAIRNNNFIAHDLDIDISIFSDDFSIKLREKLEDKGFKLKYNYSLQQGSNSKETLEDTYIYKGIHIDVFGYKKKKEAMCYHYNTHAEGMSREQTIKKYGGLLCYQKCMPNSGFTKITFLDQTVNIPTDYYNHLKIIYGDDYMTPKSDWQDNRSSYTKLETVAHFERYEC